MLHYFIAVLNLRNLRNLRIKPWPFLLLFFFFLAVFSDGILMRLP